MAVKRRRHLAGGVRAATGNGHSNFSPSLLYAAAKMYYTDEATQAEVADHLQTSRATVSRLLYEARRQGIVRIEVVPTDNEAAHDLGTRVAAVLGLTAVYISEPLPVPGRSETIEDLMGEVLAIAVGRALAAVNLEVGDVMLVSSGRTIYEVARFELPRLPGVIVAPTVGGTDQPEAWYQTNEITRSVAEKIGGHPVFLYAPAQPGPDLYERLVDDPSTHRVLRLWEGAKCAVLGVGAPPATRQSMPGWMEDLKPLFNVAAGDICTRLFDLSGKPLPFPGSERLIATSYELLRSIPVTIAVAVGQPKIPSLLAGARAGWFNTLVTDAPTATALLARSGADHSETTEPR